MSKPNYKKFGRKGGKASTDAKAAAARANGRKGGRPRKNPATPAQGSQNAP